MMEADLLIHIAAITPITKSLVDVLRIAVPEVRGRAAITVLSAVVLSVFAAVLWRVALGEIVTGQVWAQSVFIGVLAAMSSVGVTELQKKSNNQPPTDPDTGAPLVNNEPVSLARREDGT